MIVVVFRSIILLAFIHISSAANAMDFCQSSFEPSHEIKPYEKGTYGYLVENYFRQDQEPFDILVNLANIRQVAEGERIDPLWLDLRPLGIELRLGHKNIEWFQANGNVQILSYEKVKILEYRATIIGRVIDEKTSKVAEFYKFEIRLDPKAPDDFSQGPAYVGYSRKPAGLFKRWNRYMEYIN